MKRILALTILISYAHFFMLPKAEAAGPFIIYGQIQKEAMADFEEFIDETVFGHDDAKPGESDSKDPRNLGAEEVPDYFFHQHSLRVEHGEFVMFAEEYSDQTSDSIVAACFDTFSPPPEV